MNRYEEKLEARRERLLERAAKHRKISEASFQRVDRICKMIPLGQPILVGHHSERHARADQARIHNGMRKGIDEGEYAKDLERRAESIGTHGVSSDDPEAVVKLKEQLASLEKKQERMKAANAIVHKKPKNEVTPEKMAALAALGFSGSLAAELFTPDFCGRIGFANYQLTNNGANIRRIKARVEELSKHENREKKETSYLDGTLIVRENPDVNRIQLIFDKKPDEETRKLCKQSGFRWSPYEGAWQRQLNTSGIWAAKYVVEQLTKKGAD